MIQYSEPFSVWLLCFILCSGQNVTHTIDSQEAINVKVLLQASSSSPASSTTTTTEKSKVSPTAKTFKQGQEIEEEDYNFHTDRLPELSEDEFNNLSEDANPLHFLKQLPMQTENQQLQEPEVPVESKPEVQAQPKPDITASVIPSQASGSPIYITIPIYISTAGKLPLTLTIGDQELSLNKIRKKGNSALGRKPPSTKAPNSHYNRLLETPKRRTTNRHRSQLKSHIYAIKDRQDSMFKPKQ